MKIPIIICGVIDLLSASLNVFLLQTNEFHRAVFEKVVYGLRALPKAEALNLFGLSSDFCKNTLVWNTFVQFILGIYLLTSLVLRQVGENRRQAFI